VEDSLVDSEIIHSGEGGDIKWWLEPRNKFLVFAIACLALYCFSLFILVWLFILHSIIAFISSLSLSVYTHLDKEAIEYLNLYSRRIKRRSSRALHGKFGFNPYFE